MAGRERMRLTDALIARLRSREHEFTLWDTRLPGLGVRVRPSGGTSFVLLHDVDGHTKRISLGPVTSRSIDDVRRECHALIANTADGTTTRTDQRPPLFREFISGPWKDTCYSRYKPSTREFVDFSLSRHLVPVFGATRLDRITRGQVMKWFETYSQSAPGGANGMLKILRQILNFAMACGNIESNPTRSIKPNRRTAITRFLSRVELQRLHRALDELSQRNVGTRQQADIIRLLLLTGCRRGEILSLRWTEVGKDTLSLGDAKTGPRTVHLNAEARRIIERQPRGESAFVFPSPLDKARPRGKHLPLWNSVRRQSGIEDVRLHDLRHTCASFDYRLAD